MSVPNLPALHLPATWSVTGHRVTRTRTEFFGTPDGTTATTIVVERSGAGRLADAYPISTHDIEIQVLAVQPRVLTAVLQELTATIQQADPECRRVVFAAPAGDLASVAAAEQAGFRYVVDVDIFDGSVSLMVVEPAWVAHVDMDLDHMPLT